LTLDRSKIDFFLHWEFFFLVGLGLELRTSCLQSSYSTAWGMLTLVILEMRSHELFPGLILNCNPPDWLPSS
jgi:hypothetical protein